MSGQEAHRGRGRRLGLALACAAALLLASLPSTRHAGATVEGAITYTVSQDPPAGSVLQVGGTLTFTVDITDAPGAFPAAVNFTLRKPPSAAFESFGQQAGNLVTSCTDNAPAAGYVRCTLAGGVAVPAGGLSTGGDEIVLRFTLQPAATAEVYSDSAVRALFIDAGTGFTNNDVQPDNASGTDTIAASVGGFTVANILGAGANVTTSFTATPAALFEGGTTALAVAFSHAFAPVGPTVQPLEVTVTNGDIVPGSLACPGGTGAAEIAGTIARCTGSTVASGSTMSFTVRARDTATGDDITATLAAPSLGLTAQEAAGAAYGTVVQLVPVAEVGLDTPAAPPWTAGSSITVCTGDVASDVASDSAAGSAQDASLVQGTSTLVPVTPLGPGDFTVTGPSGPLSFTYIGGAGSCGGGQGGLQFTPAAPGSYTVTAAYNGDTTSAATLAATHGTNTLAFSVQTTNPVPAITSISPTSTPAGTSGFTLTVNGSNFVPSSVVRWNGGDRTTEFVSSTLIKATITASDVATEGSRAVTVVSPGPGGGTSAPATFTVTGAPNPVPVAATLTPSSAQAGIPGFTLIVDGASFVNGAKVRWNGNDRVTELVSATRLSATLLTSDLATPGTAYVTVSNPGPGGGVSVPLPFTVQAANPAPAATSLQPATMAAGSAAFTLTVNGSSFVNGAIVRWNGSDRETTFVTSSKLTAAIPASDVAAPGTANVVVWNPAPGGGSSQALTFTIANAAPGTPTLTPATATAGSEAFSLTVNGSGFSAQSKVRWNGSDRTTAFVSATQLTADITAADIASAGTVQVVVYTPAPGGGTSPAATFTINNPAPAITSLSPDSKPALAAAFTLTVTGTGFVQGSKVKWNGSERPTTFVSTTTLEAAISSDDVRVAGTAKITVANGTPGGGTSNEQTFTIGAPGRQATDQLVVVAGPAGQLAPRSRLSFRATTGSLSGISAVTFVIKRASDGKYWNGTSGAWQADVFENAGTKGDSGWTYAPTGAQRRAFAGIDVAVEARATGGDGATYASKDTPTITIR